jgi:hypothetical protein
MENSKDMKTAIWHSIEFALENLDVDVVAENTASEIKQAGGIPPPHAEIKKAIRKMQEGGEIVLVPHA